MNFRRAIPTGNRMLHLWRSLRRPKPALLGAALLATASALCSCSEQPASLADYIAAICSKQFRSSPKDEAPFLAENVSAMTKMMIDMGIQPSGT
ncbi:hypothetical protein [Bradyrhizobium sp. Ash2021]|uniref:hypothetical protein n=1 Tax=Bradyrhizobium sp. Ash2021 TaxID=2954771 RepID=UPI0035BF01F2